VKRSGAENAVEASEKWQAEKVGGNELYVIAKVGTQILLRVKHHVARNIEADDAAARHILQEQASQLASAAAGVEDTLISTQVEIAEYALPP
jgi:hypothetical protein